MEARLTGGTQNQVTGGVNPRELTPETYQYYCRLFIIKRIFEVVPPTSLIEYGHISKLINSIDPVLFKNLQLETNKILLLNEIYSTFMEALNFPLSEAFLYEKISHIASYDPVLYQ